MAERPEVKKLSESELVKLQKEADEDFSKEYWEKASEKYGFILAGRGSEDAPTLLKRSTCAMNLGLYNNAYSDAKHALGMEPKNLEAIITCGKSCMELNLFEEALSYFQDGLKIDSKHKDIIQHLKFLHQKIVRDYTIKGRKEECTYSAVKFCSQDPYPGDSEALSLEYAILAKKYKIPADEPKAELNQKEAIERAANSFRIRGQSLKDAIVECSRAISMDPTNMVYRQLRADMYLEKGDRKKALADFWAIPKGSRSYDVWKVGGTILRELELPVSAEFWFRKASKLSEENDDEAAMLFQQVRVQRLYDPLTKEFPVKVEFRQFGRGVYATEDIREGETAFVDTPVVRGQVLSSNNEVPACSHCARSLLTAEQYFGDTLKSMTEMERELVKIHWPNVTPIFCDDCGRAKYCSDDCRLEAWDSYHQVICPKQNPASVELYDLVDNNGWGYREDGTRGEIWGGHYSLMILANIWASIIVEAKRLMKKEGLTTPSSDHWAKAKAPYRRFIAYGSIPVGKRMPHMLPVFQRVFKDCGDNVTYHVTEDDFNGRYYQATCNLQVYSDTVNPYRLFMTNLSDDLRGIHMIKYLQVKAKDALFVGMFPLHACLNHSCCHNVDVRDGGSEDPTVIPGVMVVANRDISAGEELFTTYINPQMLRSVRRAWLYKSFNFWCQCPKCKFEGDDNTYCSNCMQLSRSTKGFQSCGKCKRAFYCSVKCQKAAWKKGHKQICQPFNKDSLSITYEIDKSALRL